MLLARIAVLALALTHAVGLAEQVRRAACEQACRDDGCESGCGDGCGPDEQSCRCHAPAATQLVAAGAAVVTAADPPAELAPRVAIARVHASPDPREILHVPRLAG